MKKAILYLLLLISSGAWAQTGGYNDGIPAGDTQPLSNIFRWRNPNDTTSREVYINFGKSAGILRTSRMALFSDIKKYGADTSILIHNKSYPAWEGKNISLRGNIDLSAVGAFNQYQFSTRSETNQAFFGPKYLGFFDNMGNGLFSILYNSTDLRTVITSTNSTPILFQTAGRVGSDFDPINPTDFVRLQDINKYLQSAGGTVANDTTYLAKYLKYFYVFGTSVEAGQGAVPNTYAWPHLYGNKSGGFEINYAISGTSLVDFAPTDSSMFNRTARIVTYSAGRDSILFIPYSINDGNNVSGTFNVTTYRTKLVSIINSAKAKGWPGSKIVYFTIWNASANNIIIDTCQRNTAIATGTRWVAVRDSMVAHGGDALLNQSDHTHPINKGHELIAKVVYGAIGSGNINTLVVNSNITSNGYLYPRLGIYGSGPNGLVLGAINYNNLPPVIATQGNSIIYGTQVVNGASTLTGGATIQTSLILPGATSFTMGTGTFTANGIFNLGGTLNAGISNFSGNATFNGNISSSKIINQNASVNSSLQILNTNTSTGTSASTLYQTTANDKTYSATLTGSTATTNPSFLVENVSTGVTRRWTIAGSRYFEISPSTFRIFSAGLTASKLLFSNSSQEISTTGIGTSSQLLFADGSFATSSGDVTNLLGAFTIGANKITYAKMQSMTTNKLLGSGSGTAVSEITLGSGFSFSGSTLNFSNPAGLIIGTPTIVAGTGAGTSPTVSVTSNGRGLQVTVTTGTLPTGTNSIVATVTLANPLSFTPYPVFSSPPGLSAASMIGISSSGPSNVTITSGTTALTAATTYVWNITL